MFYKPVCCFVVWLFFCPGQYPKALAGVLFKVLRTLFLGLPLLCGELGRGCAPAPGRWGAGRLPARRWAGWRADPGPEGPTRCRAVRCRAGAGGPRAVGARVAGRGARGSSAPCRRGAGLQREAAARRSPPNPSLRLPKYF